MSKPTKPGWYRARWNLCRVAPWPPDTWGCVFFDGRCVWSEKFGDWVTPDSIAAWGERISMPDEISNPAAEAGEEARGVPPSAPVGRQAAAGAEASDADRWRELVGRMADIEYPVKEPQDICDLVASLLEKSLDLIDERQARTLLTAFGGRAGR